MSSFRSCQSSTYPRCTRSGRVSTGLEAPRISRLRARGTLPRGPFAKTRRLQRLERSTQRREKSERREPMTATAEDLMEAATRPPRNPSPYDQYIESTGVPIYRGYAIEDARTIPVGPWPDRECNAAFAVLAGQRDVSEIRITEIPPGGTTRPVKFALDEIVYVVDGRGLTTIWAGDGPKKSFEWSKRSIFVIPGGCTYQLSNTQGHEPTRLMHYNYLPTAMLLRPEAEFYFESAFVAPERLYSGDAFATAKAIESDDERARSLGRPVWFGNFFPDMAVWDKLDTYQERGAGGFHVTIRFAGSAIPSHMSVFPPGRYKKAHYHGPGTA